MFPIAALCRVLGVSPSGYYAWCKRPPSTRAQADEILLGQIRAIHARSRGTYGARRIRVELRAQGMRCARKRVARLMRQAGSPAPSGVGTAAPRDRIVRRSRHRTSCSGILRPSGQISSGSRTLRTCPPAKDGFIWQRSWMPGAVASWAGRWGTRFGPSSLSTRLTWRCGTGGRQGWSIIPIAGRSIRASRSAGAVRRQAWCRRWAPSVTLTITLLPRHSSQRSRRSC